MRDQTVYDWGAARHTAPSIKRADAWGWLCASALLGVTAGGLALALSWRALPWLPAPPGALPAHLAYWVELAARLVAKGAFASDARDYARFWASMADGERRAIVWRCVLAACAAAMPATLLARSYLTPRDSLIHMRGSKRHSGREAVELLNAQLASRVAERPDHEIAPGVPYPADLWTRHVLLVGGTGSGKSTVLKPIIEKVVASGERLIVFDPKGEFTQGFAELAIVGPWDARSFAWDIARDMRNVGDMRRFAISVIQDSQDPMWANASRQILVGFMLYLRSTRGVEWGWGELAELLALPQASLLAIMSKHHPEAARSVAQASVTTQGILINLSSFCSSIHDLAEAWGDAPPERRISFVEWTLGGAGPRQIVLQGHGAYEDLSQRVARGIVEVVASIVCSPELGDDEGNAKLFLICDEFPRLGPVPMRRLFDMGRSRNCRCVVACQDFAQLEEVHGPHFVKSVVSMSGTLIVGQVMQGDTAEQLAKALGTREVERPNVSSSSGGGAPGAAGSSTLSFARDEVPIYKPSELGSRLGPTPDQKGVVMALITGGQAYELFWPRFQLRTARPRFVPAAWTLGMARLVESDSEARELPTVASPGRALGELDLADPTGPVATARHEAR